MRIVPPRPSAMLGTVVSAVHCAIGVPTLSPVHHAAPNVIPEELWPSRGKRAALVLGAGGAPGVAWQAAKLQQLEMAGVLDTKSVPFIIGTSAGALVGMLIRCGLSPTELLDMAATGNFRGSQLEDGKARSEPVTLQEVREEVDRHWLQHNKKEWPDKTTWIVAADARSGERVCFGSPGSPKVSPGTAVAASCAVPLLLPPVRAVGRDFVDGALVSFTSLDLALKYEPEEVFLLDPAATADFGPQRNPLGLLVGVARRAHGSLVGRQIDIARRAGATVHFVQPSRPEIEAMGSDLLDTGHWDRVIEAAMQSPVRL